MNVMGTTVLLDYITDLQILPTSFRLAPFTTTQRNPACMRERQESSLTAANRYCFSGPSRKFNPTPVPLAGRAAISSIALSDSQNEPTAATAARHRRGVHSVVVER